MKIALVSAILAVPITGGMIGTWMWARRRERGAIASRLEKLIPLKETPAAANTILLKKQEDEDTSGSSFLHDGIESLKTLLAECGLESNLTMAIAVLVPLLLLPIIIGITAGINPVICIVVGLILPMVPIGVLKARAEVKRTKFTEQLPDAIDLMVAILRSGHSVSQSVAAVAQDVPAPCGTEFQTLLHRMNLGQPLSEAMVYSARRFSSYELDLVRRAVSIQNEVGGSLAELLEKTNSTLRERLKLVRQLKVITAQSRLSAQIVGALPFVLAIALNFLNPGYLQWFFEDQEGQAMLCAVLLLQGLGFLVMRRMSTMRA